MPFSLTTPEQIVLTKNELIIVGFGGTLSFDNKNNTFHIMYAEGNRDTNGIFTQIGELKEIYYSGAAYIELMMRNFTLYSSMKNTFYDEMKLKINKQGVVS